MTKEQRLVFLAALTLIVYAVSILITKGALIFPFPINQFLFFGVAIQLAYWHRNQKGLAIASVLTSLAWAGSSQVTWTIILPLDKAAKVVQSNTTEWFLLCFYELLVIGAIVWLIRSENPLQRVLFGLGALGLIAGILTPYELVIPASLSLIVLSIYVCPILKPFHLLWLLLLILESTEWLTLYLNGSL